MGKKVDGYSTAQIALHWTVVVLVAFQYVAHDPIARWWDAAGDPGSPLREGPLALVYLHAIVGGMLFALVFARLYLRFSRGAPPPPADEPRVIQIMAEAVHGAIYVLLVALPASGAVAWFAGARSAGAVHGSLTNLLLAAIAAHVAGALFQHFVRRSDVLMRMLQSERL